jgi:MFS family permease
MFKDTIPALSTMFSSCRHGRKVTTSIPTIEVVSVTDFIAEFNYPSGSLLGILSASYWVGNVFGVFAITPLSDRWGRRMAMFVGSMIAVVGTALCSGAVNC